MAVPVGEQGFKGCKITNSVVQLENKTHFPANGCGVGFLPLAFCRFYTWYATTDSRNLAPFGWHVPSDAEFTTLEICLFDNGYNYDPSYYGDMVGKSLASNILWNTDNKGGNIGCYLALNNFSDFNALPVGKRKTEGNFDYFKYSTLLWSFTTYSNSEAFGAATV